MGGSNSIIAQARKETGYQGMSSIGVMQSGGTGVGLFGSVSKNVEYSGIERKRHGALPSLPAINK
jgi:hypothetical protein